MIKRSTLLGLLMLMCFIFIYGTCGSYECDALTVGQAFTRIAVATIVFFGLDYMRVNLSKREFEKKKSMAKAATFNHAHRK